MELTRFSGILLGLFGILISVTAFVGTTPDMNLLGSGITSIFVGLGIFLINRKT